MHWKLARDPFYGPLFSTQGLHAVERAGFFFDSSVTDAPLDDPTLCTPLHHVRRNLDDCPPGRCRSCCC